MLVRTPPWPNRMRRDVRWCGGPRGSRGQVLYLSDGRFMLHSSNSSIFLGARTPERVLSSSWMISSKEFGTVYLSSLNNKGQATPGTRLLSLHLALSLAPHLRALANPWGGARAALWRIGCAC